MGHRQNEKPTEGRQEPQKSQKSHHAAEKYFPVRKGPTENELAIAALNEEARRRRLSYGKLVGLLDDLEKLEIIKRFRARRKSK